MTALVLRVCMGGGNGSPSGNTSAHLLPITYYVDRSFKPFLVQFAVYLGFAPVAYVTDVQRRLLDSIPVLFVSLRVYYVQLYYI